MQPGCLLRGYPDRTRRFPATVCFPLGRPVVPRCNIESMYIRALTAVLAALATGTAIALQSTMNGRAGAVIGPIRTGILVNAVGGSMALVIVLLIALASSAGVIPAGLLSLTGRAVPATRLFSWIAFAGFLGITIIVGVSFAVQGVGVTAGLSAVILAQLLVGMLIDQAGGAGGIAIAIDLRRLAGVAAMAAGVWLLVPRTG